MVALLQLVVCLSYPATGHAEEAASSAGDDSSLSDAERAERAIVLYQEAEVHYREGRFAQAVDLLVEAIELQDAAALHYNLGRSYQELGRWADAAAAYRAYLEREPESPRRAQIESRIEQLDHRAADEVAGGAQRFGGAEDGAGQSIRRTDRARISPWPWVIAGTGAASLVVGIIFAGLFNGQMELAEDPSTDNLSALEAYELAGSYGTAANTTLALGGALSIAGLVWGIIDVVRARRAPASTFTPTSSSSTNDAP